MAKELKGLRNKIYLCIGFYFILLLFLNALDIAWLILVEAEVIAPHEVHVPGLWEKLGIAKFIEIYRHTVSSALTPLAKALGSIWAPAKELVLVHPITNVGIVALVVAFVTSWFRDVLGWLANRTRKNDR